MPKFITEIKTDATAIFQERPNKYIAIVDIIEPYKQQNITVHVHDPGRLTEILYQGNLLRIKSAENPNRKTAWDVIAGKVENQWVLIHSGYHRKIAMSLFEKRCIKEFGNPVSIKPEITFAESRLDFLLEYKRKKRFWIETKGCTLVENGIAKFPDAPTKRGTKHLRTLLKLTEKGEDACVMFMIMNPETECFKPNEKTDPEFAQTFKLVEKSGVRILPVVFSYENDEIHYVRRVSVCK